jgi:hypothetical protein
MRWQIKCSPSAGIDVQLRRNTHRLGVGRIEGRGLVEVVERRVAGEGDPWRFAGPAEVHEDGLDHSGLGQERDQAHFGPAARARQRETLVDARDEGCPQIRRPHKLDLSQFCTPLMH